MASKWKNTYEEAFQGFLERGLYLDTPKEEFHFKKKSDCHCLKHPNNKMKYEWAYVRLGRFSCKECKKEHPYIKYTIDDKKKLLTDNDFEYIDGDLNKVENLISVKCKNGHIFSRRFKDFQRGNLICPFCNGRIPNNYWNMDTCREHLTKEMPGYKILDLKRENHELRVLIKCPVENHPPYWTSWTHIAHEKTICRQCYYDNTNKQDWTLDNAKRFLQENGYEMLDENEYISSHQYVYCRDKIGFIYKIRIHNLLKDDRNSFSILKHNDYAVHNIKLFCKLYRPDYEYIEDKYYGNDARVKWKYLGSGLPEWASPIFESSVSNMLTAYCKHPLLSMSQLESHCKMILDKYLLNYEMQKTFDKCVGKIKLRFDFYLCLNNIEYCIEVDGLQHDIPIPKFGDIEEFKKRKKYDEIKNNYCKNHNIILIRIKQKEYRKMESILIKELGLQIEEPVA